MSVKFNSATVAHRRQPKDRTGPRWGAGTPHLWGVVAVSLLAAGVGIIFGPSLRAMEEVWRVDPGYSHGYLVPLVSLAALVRAWLRDGPPLRSDVDCKDVVLGLAEVALGATLHLGGLLLSNWVVEAVALVCILRGSLLVMGGSESNRAYGFAACFLVFLAPWPSSWHQPLAVGLQQTSSVLSAWALELTGLPVYREGYLIYLPGYTMEVGQACSGLRQLLAIVALAAAWGHFADMGRWRSACLLVLAFPVAVVGNSLRIFLTGQIAYWWGSEWAAGIFHTMEGLLVLAFSAGVLVLISSLLGGQRASRGLQS